MTTTLGIDTTSRYASVSVAVDEEIRLEYNFATLDDLSATLIPSIEFVLNSIGVKIQDIDVFGICTGPGRFTGIRVGLSTLKGLLMAGPKPVVAVDTLKTLAYKFNYSTTPVISLIDAKREEVYAAGFRFQSPGLPEEWLPPALIGIGELKDYVGNYIPDIDGTQLRFVGSGAEAYAESIKESFALAKIRKRSYFVASELCKLAFKMYNADMYETDMQKVAPFYIRKPDAEQNYEKAQAKAAEKNK